MTYEIVCKLDGSLPEIKLENKFADFKGRPDSTLYEAEPIPDFEAIWHAYGLPAEKYNQGRGELIAHLTNPKEVSRGGPHIFNKTTSIDGLAKRRTPESIGLRNNVSVIGILRTDDVFVYGTRFGNPRDAFQRTVYGAGKYGLLPSGGVTFDMNSTNILEAALRNEYNEEVSPSVEGFRITDINWLGIIRVTDGISGLKYVAEVRTNAPFKEIEALHRKTIKRLNEAGIHHPSQMNFPERDLWLAQGAPCDALEHSEIFPMPIDRIDDLVYDPNTTSFTVAALNLFKQTQK